MLPFGHVLSLLAFVFAVALTQLLTRAGSLLVARAQVKFYGLTVLTGVLAIMLIFENWLSIWELRDKVQWDLLTIGTLFLFAVSVYFISVFALPGADAKMDADLEHFYWSHRKPYYIAWFACEALAILCNMEFSNPSNGTKMLGENFANIVAIAPILLALFVTKRWAQWVGALLLLAVNIYFLFSFDFSLS